MQDNPIYKIIFTGQDYAPIIEAAEKACISKDDDEYVIDSYGRIIMKNDENNSSDIGICRKILDRFLYEVAPDCRCDGKMFPINSESGKKRELYNPYFGNGEKKGYFCGIVGVLRRTITISIGNDSDNTITFDATLQIKSRLDIGENGTVSKPYFLSTMLLRDKLKLSEDTIPSSYEEIYDYLLLFWFKDHFQNAMLKGYYRTYRRYEKNDDRLKGSIDVSRHIRLNMGQSNGKISYSFRENTIDNYLNRLIVLAYKHLKIRYRELVEKNIDNQLEIKKAIDFLDDEIGNTDHSAYIINKNIKVIAHPYYTEYEQLRQTCLKILRDEGITFFDGDTSSETKGILFYLPDLWELFLKDEIITNGMPDDTKFKYQDEVMNFGYEKEENEYSFKQKTYPDYVFYHQNIPYMILDAKCKPKWEGVFDDDSVSDVMEDYNKCIRDMVALDVHGTGVVFPTGRNDEINVKVIKHRISDYNDKDMFYTIPIKVPRVSDDEQYSDWSEKFEESLGVANSWVNKILNENLPEKRE